MSHSIVHVIHSGAIGGGPRVVLDLARRVPGHHIIAAPDDGPLLEDALADGIDTIALRHTGKYSFPASSAALVRAFRSATLAHVHGQYAAFYTAPIARLTRTPTIYTAHFPSFITDTNAQTRVRNYVVEKVSCATSTHTVACSHTMRREFLARRLVCASRITTIYNGVSKQVADVNAGAVRDEMGIRADDQVIVGVGRFTNQKGFDIVLGAVPEILSQTERVKLILVGDGEGRAALEEQALALKIRDKVCFTGFRRDTANFMHLADVVAVPSRYDVFPLVPLEAMMAGRAVVATDLPVLREAILDGVTGLLTGPDSASFASALLAVLRDAPRRKSMARSGQQRAEQLFGVDAMANEYARTYATMHVSDR